MYYQALTFINTLKHKWFYILASCIIPLTLFTIGTGRDIVAILAEGNLKNNTIYLSVGMMLLGVTIWMLPAIPLAIYSSLAKRVLGYSTSKRSLALKVRLFTSVYKEYNADKTKDYIKYKPALPTKTLALLPWIILNLQILNFLLEDYLKAGSGYACIISVLFLILLYIINHLASKAIRTTLFRQSWKAAIVLLLPLVAIYSLFAKINPNGFGYLLLYMIANYIVFNVIILYIDAKLELYNATVRIKAKDILKRIRYILAINGAVILTTIAFLTVLTFEAFELKAAKLSGVVLLVFGIIPYILFFDNLFSALKYAYRFLSTQFESKLRSWRLLSVFVMVIFLFGCWFLFIKNNNKFNIPDSEARKDYPNLIEAKYSLTNRFDKFYEGLEDEGKDTVNVFLVSGQGGGSRAAACFLSIMLNADRQNKNWYNHIFSISTISGSSAGAMQYFYLHQLHNSLLEQIMYDGSQMDISDQAVKSCYSYNYMNSNFLGLLYYDRLPLFLKCWPARNIWANHSFDSLSKHVRKDSLNTASYFCTFNRNYIQEEEERWAILKFINNYVRKDTSKYSSLNSIRFDSLCRKIAQNYYCYKNLIEDTLPEHPLYIMNTTMLSRGRKGYFASANIDVNPNWTNLAFCNPYMSMHSASIASQSVPILNTFYETHETALCDGGFYENSGTSTTYEIYKQLRAYCSKNEKYKKVRFVLVNFYNQTESIESESYGRSAFITTVSGLFAQIFNGHEKDALENIKRSTRYFNADPDDMQDTVINFNLNYPVATTRALRKVTLDTILKRSVDPKAMMYLGICLNAREADLNLAPGKKVKYILYPQTSKGSNFQLDKAKLDQCGLASEVSLQKVEYLEGNFSYDIRYFHEEDAAMAQRIKLCLDKDSTTIFEIKDLSQTTYKNMVRPHTIEVWYK